MRKKLTDCFRKVLILLPDSLYLKLQYYHHFQKRLNLKSPRSFNEKLQWLKLHYRREIMILMVDKFEVKKYVSDTIGSQYVVPLLGVWNNANEIDFNSLPDQFVLKCNHDCNGLVICKDKKEINQADARIKLNKALKDNGYWHSREWPYKRVNRRIIAEEYLEDKQLKELRDYKFFCFSGIVKCFKVDYGRFTDHHANYFDPKGNLLQFGEVAYMPIYEKEIDLPDCLPEMISLAEKLSEGFPFMRVDFYYVNKRVFFGEITFFPAAGFGKFTSDEWDLILGDWLVLPEGKRCD